MTNQHANDLANELDDYAWKRRLNFKPEYAYLADENFGTRDVAEVIDENCLTDLRACINELLDPATPPGTRGYATMRNADGTHWLFQSFGWSQERDERSFLTHADFLTMQTRLAEKGLLEVGDYGIYQLTFHPEDAS